MKKKKSIYVFTNFLIIIFCLLIYRSIPLVIDNYTQRSFALEIRLTFVYLSIPSRWLL